ncbi:MAG TPA: fluoride efflux transporter CrcB [Saprospiraceae bacterium]|nr:fluoride efflux transporter CrcB [Saprospiraceae bacterium]HPI08745.1 fluoride efflux transporter CrcB [Saprospiraceae bacterium]
MAGFDMPQWFAFLMVFIGGGLGSISRYGLALLIWPIQGKFPWATFAANALACVLLGYWMGLHTGGSLNEQRRLLLTTGFCGGFSTFSTFTAESFRLWQDGRQTEAFMYVAGSLTVCMVCLFLGLKMATLNP